MPNKKKYENESLQPVIVGMPPSMIEKLDKEKEFKKTSRNEIIRKACEKHLKGGKK